MKKVLFISATIFMLISCGAKYPYKRYSNAIDFTEITRSGFFITESNSVSFQYDPVGSVSAVVESGFEVIGENKEQAKDNIYSYKELAKLKFGNYKNARAEDAITELVDAAKTLGADGIINLNVNYISATYDKGGAIISPSSYIVSGMAIKRK